VHEKNLAWITGPKNEPLLDLTVHELLTRAVAQYGEREALVSKHQGIRWTYAQLYVEVDRLARALLVLGVRTGDRVALCAPNQAEWIVTQLATASIGAVLVSLNPAYRAAELQFALDKTEAMTLIIANRFKRSDYLAMLREIAPELFNASSKDMRLDALPHLRNIVCFGQQSGKAIWSYEQVLCIGEQVGKDELERVRKTLRPNDPINIQFTSGTTGVPKGATLTHKNIVNNGFFTGHRMGFSHRDRLCIPVPLFHCLGMVMSVLACVGHGATMVLSGASFEPRDVLRAIEEERCTALNGVPTMYIALLAHAEFSSFDLSSLRTGIVTGAPCPVEMMRRIVSDMGMKEITIAFGMTETSPVIFQSGTDETLERRTSTVGQAHPHVEVRLVDEAGRPVQRGERGQVCVRGYSVMHGYWSDPDKTSEVIDVDGWMHTGDVAVLDGDSYLNVVGRLKDMVIRGGENLFPREIEEFLVTHPKVQQAQVFGVPDPKFGEELCAWIIPVQGCSIAEAELKSFCDGRISHQKIPRYVRIVNEIPVTASGKAIKAAMRKQMIEELELSEEQTA
jgi:fatty-acyl-CoA synthase